MKSLDETAERQSHKVPVRFADLPDILTPSDLIAYLPIGRDAVYHALQTQTIRNVRVGQKFIIPKGAVRDFLGGAVE